MRRDTRTAPCGLHERPTSLKYRRNGVSDPCLKFDLGCSSGPTCRQEVSILKLHRGARIRSRITRRSEYVLDSALRSISMFFKKFIAVKPVLKHKTLEGQLRA